MSIRLFEVGGHVRDSLMGIKSNDIDIAVEASSWEEMLSFVEKNTKKIWLIKPEFLTIRAQSFDGQTRDFVMCRKDGAYSDGRHPDSVEPGTIFEDQSRRDFSVNSLARNMETGEILDPFGGIEDIKNKVLRCVGSAEERFNEDSLRILRAFRFWVTKGFEPDEDIMSVFCDSSWGPKLASVSRERVMEEMRKCFAHNTLRTLYLLPNVSYLYEAIFSDDIWLKPTLEKK